MSIKTMADMAKTKITPRAKHPDRTQKFVEDVKIVLETFDDEISSFSEPVKRGAYKNLLEAYRDTLIPVWNLA